ncbi:MAG: SIS domain-containing protein [Anaerorhabdus sp.]
METLDSFLKISQREVEIVIETLDVQSLKQATNLILNCERQGGRVHVTGIGKPGHVAGYIASLLSSTGTSAYELHGTEAVHGSCGQVKKGDVVIAISNSGETAELKATVEALKSNEAHVISCTRSKSSWLAQHTEVCLVAGVSQEGGPLNKAPRASILAEILVLQALSVLLQDAKQLTVEDYVKWHPGGSLGEGILQEKKGERK